MTSEPLQSNGASEDGQGPPNIWRPLLSQPYNSALPEVASVLLAGWPVQPMITPDSQRQAPLELRAFIEGMPALVWTALPDGSPEVFNPRTLGGFVPEPGFTRVERYAS